MGSFWMSFAVIPKVVRLQPGSSFAHFSISWEALIALVCPSIYTFGKRRDREQGQRHWPPQKFANTGLFWLLCQLAFKPTNIAKQIAGAFLTPCLF